MKRFSLLVTISAAMLMLAGCASQKMPLSTTAALSGSEEVPPVNTPAFGAVQITVQPDHSITGKITTSDVDATSAHIHEGAPGKNGPVIIPLAKSMDNTFVVPPGMVLSDAQYKSYQDGKLYVNVHSPRYPGGEIRAQLKPPSTSPPPEASPSTGMMSY